MSGQIKVEFWSTTVAGENQWSGCHIIFGVAPFAHESLCSLDPGMREVHGEFAIGRVVYLSGLNRA